MMKYYTKEHEWLELAADGIATVGITDYAQKQLGDVVYVELPAIGKAVTQSGEMAVVESVKAASEVYAPISGTVVAVNQDLPANPALVNSEPQGAGWFVKLQLSDEGELAKLLDEAGYQTYLASLS
ncbi:MAG: glycine cleavage system protein GcvH [Alphaproteobacteria bacterium]|nr:glycine cleavage system protein GcvH [Alphaproteobacteria bacterium]